MKIIRTSNYNIETEPQRVAAENIQNEREAKIMCSALNEHPDRSDADWFSVVADEHVLWRGMEDLV